MINIDALFSITYGIYIVSSGDKKVGNGYISNTVFQVTSQPPRLATCCSKDNHTCSLIEAHGAFAVSVLHEDADPKLYGAFGYMSGKNKNKLEGRNIKYGETNVPIVLDNTIASLECKVIQTIDLGTHILFIGDILNANLHDDGKDPMTYAYYRNVKKGIAPKNAPTYIDKSLAAAQETKQLNKVYKCLVCGHIYDDNIEEQKFDSLPDDWICPVCGAEKEDFTEIKS